MLTLAGLCVHLQNWQIGIWELKPRQLQVRDYGRPLRVAGGIRGRMSAEHMEAIIRVHENLRRRGGFFQSGNARRDDANDSDNELHDVVDDE